MRLAQALCLWRLAICSALVDQEPLIENWDQVSDVGSPSPDAVDDELPAQKVMRRSSRSESGLLEVASALSVEDGIRHHRTEQHTSRESIRNSTATFELLQSLRPCVKCSSYKRFGEHYDGGYVMCADEGAFTGVKAGFSFGIEGRDVWGAAVSQTLKSLPVFEFDCFDGRQPNCSGECDLRIHKVCLSDSDKNHTDPPQKGEPPNATREYASLHNLFARYAPVSNMSGASVGGDLVAKIDVEGAEWGAFNAAKTADLQRMRQVVVEFHYLANVDAHENYAQALLRLFDAGFAVAHLHGNNYGPLDVFGEGLFTVPDVVEVTLVNLKAFPLVERIQGCRADQDYIFDQDSRNDRWSMELPMAELPGQALPNVAMATNSEQCRYFCPVARLKMWLRVDRIPLFIVFIGRVSFLGGVIIAALLCFQPSIQHVNTEQSKKDRGY